MSGPLDPVRRETILESALADLLDLPEQIDRYVVRGELGRGGMGVVYDAVDPTLERPVAIKIIHPGLLRDTDGAIDAHARFEREMRAVSPIFHPNVVSILDAGVTRLQGVSTAYYVMERIVGESLEDRIRRSGPLDRKEALRIASSVARGLAALHAQGLVHRDIKPSNVLLPIGQQAKVTDFGLVLLVNSPEEPEGEPTIAGSAHGLAPEQLHTGQIDGRADLFALGSLIVRLFTGREPFAASSLRKRLNRIECAAPDGVDGLPPDVATLTRSLLEKSPTNRPRHAADVAESLDRLRRRRFLPSGIISRFTAVASLALLGLLGASEWHGNRLDDAIEDERIRHEAAVAGQLERASVLSASLLGPSLVANLPSDQRRAAEDRLEGIANRLAFERRRHDEALAALAARRWALAEWLAKGGAEGRGPSFDSIGSPESAHSVGRIFEIADSANRLGDEGKARIERQIDLLWREFGLSVELRIEEARQASTAFSGSANPRGQPATLGLRIVLDLDSNSGMVDSTEALERFLPDSLLGALLREQVLPLAAHGEVAFGLRLALRVIRDRLRNEIDGTIAESNEGKTLGPNTAIAALDFGTYSGAGARAEYSIASSGLERRLDDDLRGRFLAGPTPETTWERFRDWLSLETHDAEVEFFTPASREIVRGWPASRPYWRFMQGTAERMDVAVLRRGDHALLYSREHPEIAPSFFRRMKAGWQLDLKASRKHILKIADQDRRWTFHLVDAAPLAAFRQDLVVEDQVTPPPAKPGASGM